MSNQSTPVSASPPRVLAVHLVRARFLLDVVHRTFFVALIRCRMSAARYLLHVFRRGWLGAQALTSAKAFNANIGAWNTAAVSSMCNVCAAFWAWAARHRRRDALGGVVDAARAVVRGGGTDARSRVCAQTCRHAHARVPRRVGIAARTKDGIYVCMYTCIYIYVSVSMYALYIYM